MYAIDKAKTKEVLLQQKFTESSIDLLLSTFPELPDEFGPVIDQWLVDQVVPEYEYEGIAVKAVMKTRSSSFISAMRDLARLSPTFSEEERIQWRRIITTPVIYE